MGRSCNYVYTHHVKKTDDGLDRPQFFNLSGWNGSSAPVFNNQTVAAISDETPISVEVRFKIGDGPDSFGPTTVARKFGEAAIAKLIGPTESRQKALAKLKSILGKSFER